MTLSQVLALVLAGLIVAWLRYRDEKSALGEEGEPGSRPD